MITINANVDRTRLTQTMNALAQFGKAEGLTVQFVCWDVMRAIMLDMIKRTAPWTNKGVVGTYAAQKKTGQGAVRNDLDRAFADSDKVVKFDRNGVTMVRVKETGAVFPIDSALWSPDIKDRHLSVRNSKGRVPRQKRQAWVSGKDLSVYRKAVQARVGSLKAGWIPALYHFASLCRGSVGRLPQWILRQSVKAGGFGGNMRADGNGSIYSENTAHHSDAIRKDTVGWVVRYNGKNLNKFSKFRIQRLCDQFNNGKIPKPILQAAV